MSWLGSFVLFATCNSIAVIFYTLHFLVSELYIDVYRLYLNCLLNSRYLRFSHEMLIPVCLLDAIFSQRCDEKSTRPHRLAGLLASPRSFVWGDGFIGTQTYLPQKFSFSSDFGHFILKVVGNAKKNGDFCQEKDAEILPFLGGRPPWFFDCGGRVPRPPPPTFDAHASSHSA